MKQLTILLVTVITIIACHPKDTDHNGIYVAHIEGEYSIADDTLIVEDNFITKRTGYQKIRNGKLLPKALKTRTWPLNSEDAPPVQFIGDELILGRTIYTRQP